MSAANNCTLYGRLVKDPELRTSQNGKEQVHFMVAVQRAFKQADGTYGADFIGCTMFGKRAGTIAKYFRKGNPIFVCGEWHTGNYEKDGKRVYTNELYVNDFAFVGDKLSPNDNAPAADAPASANGFTPVNSAIEEEELPFA